MTPPSHPRPEIRTHLLHTDNNRILRQPKACDENKITCILEIIKISISEKHQIAASDCSDVQTRLCSNCHILYNISDLIFIYRYEINEIYICVCVCACMLLLKYSKNFSSWPGKNLKKI